MRKQLSRALPDVMAYVCFFLLGLFWDRDWDRLKVSIYLTSICTFLISLAIRWLNSHTPDSAA